jgi:hypothetical protein
MAKTYVIDNGEERHARYPKTFHIPARELRESLEVGDLIKACFREPGVDAGERMWLEIIEVGDGEYRARLDNDPAVFADLHWNDELTIRPEHVINIMKREERADASAERVAELFSKIQRELEHPLSKKDKTDA